MTQFNFSVDFEELKEKIFNSNLEDTVKSLMVLLFNKYMELEQEEFIQAQKYERTDNRQAYRNGYYERSYTTKIGTVELKVPRTRNAEFNTTLFEKYERMDQGLILTMIEMYVNGVSTRKVTNIVEQLCGESVSKSFVSNLTQRLDPEIDAFKRRSLTHSAFRYVYVDAMYIKVRENSQIVSKALYVAQGVNDDNRREIIGLMVGDGESEANWTEFFLELKSRGLKQPKMIISDAHEGLKNSIRKVFLGSIWQRCTVHFLRNINDKLPKSVAKESYQQIAQILRAETQQEARELKAAFEDHVQNNPRFNKALEILDAGFEDAIQYMLEPAPYHVSLRTTNSIERLNRELRRRDKVIGIYPNCEAAERVLGAILMQFHEKWQVHKGTFLSTDRTTIY